MGSNVPMVKDWQLAVAGGEPLSDSASGVSATHEL